MKNKFIQNLQFIFKPSYWFVYGKYNKELDQLMNYLLDNYEFKYMTRYTAYLGNTPIWIANNPYKCMIPSEMIMEYGYMEVRVSRLTIYKGNKKLKALSERMNANNITKNEDMSALSQIIKNLYSSINKH